MPEELAGAIVSTVRNYAALLGDDAAEELLTQTLDEEKETDETLTTLAKTLNLKPSGSKQGMKPARDHNRRS